MQIEDKRKAKAKLQVEAVLIKNYSSFEKYEKKVTPGFS
jgi:hypothetical protein